MPTLNKAIVVVTGANGGLGTHFVRQALERGAAKVYASARDPKDWEDDRIVPLPIDVTDAASVAAGAATARDVTVVINNAGASNGSSVLTELSGARALFETNFWGALMVTNEFTPSLKASKGTLLNVLSVLSWLGTADAYSAAKAALWQATNTQRVRLAADGVHVAGLHLGYADTPMTRGMDVPKLDPADVVRTAYDGIELGDYEILADELSVQVKAGLAARIEDLYPQLVRSSA